MKLSPGRSRFACGDRRQVAGRVRRVGAGDHQFEVPVAGFEEQPVGSDQRLDPLVGAELAEREQAAWAVGNADVVGRLLEHTVRSEVDVGGAVPILEDPDIGRDGHGDLVGGEDQACQHPTDRHVRGGHQLVAGEAGLFQVDGVDEVVEQHDRTEAEQPCDERRAAGRAPRTRDRRRTMRTGC